MDYAAASGAVGGFRNKYGVTASAPQGILNDDITVSIPQITDGTSNQWLVGEQGGAPNVYIAGGKLFDTPPFTKLNAQGEPMCINGLGWAEEMPHQGKKHLSFARGFPNVSSTLSIA